MSKKEQEKPFVKALFKKLDLNVKLIDSERPDFIFNIEGTRTGIEVTRIFKDDKIEGVPLHCLESERDSIVNIAKKKYTELNKYPALDVAVFFGTYPRISKSQRYDLAEKLADLIINNLPDTNSTIRIKNDFQDLNKFPEYIDQVRISNFSFISENHWQVPVAGIVQKTFINELQKVLDKKNKKLLSYKENCEECWLLVVADSYFPSSFFEPDDETISNKYKCDFEKSFCMWDWYGEYFEIQKI